MKLFAFFFSLFAFFTAAFSNPVLSQSNSNAVLLLSTDNNQSLVGNIAYYDLILNTLGNQVKEIDVQLLIRGPFDRQSLTFNLHPEHRNRVQVSAPMSVIEYDKYYENDDGVRVRVVMRAAGNTPFNEGSGAIPMFRIGLTSNNPGTIRGYIDSSHSYVRYADAAKNDYDNYSTESLPKLLDVIGNGTIVPSIVTSTPTPTPTPTPTSTPTVTPESVYDQEFERVAEEIEQLKNKVDEQEQRVSLLEKFMQRIKAFFANLFN